MTKEVYCPKCDQTFEEGSRRFCPTDGARLISNEFQTASAGQGIFSSSVAKSDAGSGIDSTSQGEPSFILDFGDDTRDEHRVWADTGVGNNQAVQ